MKLAFKFVLSCTKFEANMASCLSEEVKDVILLHYTVTVLLYRYNTFMPVYLHLFNVEFF